MSMSDLTVVRSAAPVREQAVELMRRALTTGRWTPGERIAEKPLLEMLGVSRTTVRESLRQLEAEGLVVVVPGKGATVASLTDEEALEIYEVREALECLAVRLFVQNASDEDIDELERRAAAVAAAHKRSSIYELLEVKDGFYDAIFAVAGNRLLSQQIRGLGWRAARLRAQSLSRPGRPAESLREIEELVSAMRDRDEVLAQGLCARHVRNAAAAALGRDGRGARGALRGVERGRSGEGLA